MGGFIPDNFRNKYQELLSPADFQDFIDYCEKPLRKSLRVNTLKISVSEFQKIAQNEEWDLSPIPWCEEGFWIEREDRTEALGR
nr:16S rRNA (cytosine(1407)-C(5))-methyltransferase RsmF [Candidatus Gracilibacteria bacterium]